MPPEKPSPLSKRSRFTILYYLWLLGLILFLNSLFFSGPGVPEISYSAFLDALRRDEVATVVITTDRIYGELRPGYKAEALTRPAAGTAAAVAPQVPASPPAPPAATGPAHHSEDVLPIPGKETPWRLHTDDWLSWFRGVRERAERAAQEHEARVEREFTVLPLTDPNLLATLQQHGVKFRARVESRWLSDLFFNWIVPFGIMFLIWAAVMRRMGQGPTALTLGRNKAKLYEADPDTRVHFADVAGVDEAVEETREIVSFLKDPQKFTRLGAKLPKGVLLVGPPGTGKTLLARAVAGESRVPFFSLSGSDFVEMFVGVGAARVRDLFAEAKKKAPCIIFIDELDAIGRTRAGQGAIAGSYDERENTLNQLLVEMDGFDGRAGVVIMAATNRPEILDPALRRPGRFDREILVDRPDKDGRLAILKLHAQRLPLGPDVDLARIASETTGFVGADLANLCNEAALLASRSDGNVIMLHHFQEAIERVIGGLEKKGRVLNPKERRTVAYHESGHAIVGYFTPGADPVQKISIVPRGRGALGYTLQAPLEDRYLMSRTEILGRIRTLLGGRAAEDIVFGEISTGASDDIQKASRIAREMLTVYGMSKTLRNLSLVTEPYESFLGAGRRDLAPSAEVERQVGEEQLAILTQCYDEAKQLLSSRRDQLEALAHRLLAQEKVDAADLLDILGPRSASAGAPA
ncbi:MAG: ATP-dependent zinc metalloprotease FtsH [Candidatus Binatia bacterium]